MAATGRYFESLEELEADAKQTKSRLRQQFKATA